MSNTYCATLSLMMATAGCGPLPQTTGAPPDLSGAAPVDAAAPDLGSGADLFSPAEWDTIRTLSPLPAPPPDPTNRYADDARAAAFGQRLFFERGFSGAIAVADDGMNGGLGMVGEKGKLACEGCHQANTPGLDDQRSKPRNVSLGISFTTRNSPSLTNVAWHEFFSWGGKWDSLWQQATAAFEGAMGGNRLQFAHYIHARYKDDYNSVFPVPLDAALDAMHPNAARFPAAGKPKKAAMDPDGAWEMMRPDDQKIVNTIFINCGKAIAAYERKLVSRNSAFDRFVAGEMTALGDSARRGLGLFIGKANCVTCHSGPNFSDEKFHNLGVPQSGSNVPMVDTGQQADLTALIASKFNAASAYSDDAVAGAARLAALGMPTDDTKGRFRTKDLRTVAATGPYLHTGALATLADVVRFYASGGGVSGFSGNKDPKMVPLPLKASEVDDLAAFLESLSGEPVAPALLQNTAAP